MTDKQRPQASPAPAELRGFLTAIGAAGVVALGLSVVEVVRTPRPLGLAAMIGVTILAGCFRLRFASVKANIAIDDTFFLSTALLFGPGAGALTTSLAAALFSLQRRQPPRRILFNVAGHAVSMGIAA